MAQSPFSTITNRWLFAAGWLPWTAVHFVMLKNWSGEWQLSLVDAIITNALLAGACLVINNILRFYRPQRQLYIYLVVMCLAISGFWSAIVQHGLGALFYKHPQYVEFLDKSMSVRFDIAFLLSGCAAMMCLLWYNLQEQKEHQQRKADAEQLSREAELYKLQQQLQPHFLFNSLNSISALAGSEPELARKMIHQLSDFLRGTLKKDDHQWVTLQEELQHLELYLEIEKVRFSHRLKTEIVTDSNSINCKIPAMLLQPIVENAIKFGLYDTIETITIRIRTMFTDNYLVVTVENPFDPETSSPAGTGFGLRSIQRRLYLLFGRNDLLETRRNENLFITSVKLPQPK